MVTQTDNSKYELQPTVTQTDNCVSIWTASQTLMVTHLGNCCLTVTQTGNSYPQIFNILNFACLPFFICAIHFLKKKGAFKLRWKLPKQVTLTFRVTCSGNLERVTQMGNAPDWLTIVALAQVLKHECFSMYGYSCSWEPRVDQPTLKVGVVGLHYITVLVDAQKRSDRFDIKTH